MKILHYVDENNLSWARPYVQILNELKKSGCQNILLCRPGKTLSGIFEDNGFEVFTYRPLLPSLPFMNLKLKKIIAEIKPDIIHTRLSSAAYLGGWAGKILKIPVLSTIDKFPKAKYYKNSSHLLPCSEAVKKHMLSMGFSENKMTVVYNAVDVNFYRTERINSNKKNICFLGMGRFVDWKGFDDLIRAFGIFMAKQNEPEKFSLRLAGDGPEMADLKKLTAELGLEKRIEFTGFVKDVRQILRDSDIYIHPSNGEEAFGLSLVEAMSAGLPVIASDSGGMTEILDNKYGLLFKRRDVHELADKMEEAVKNSEILGKAALKRAADFDITEISKKFLNIYEKFLDNKNEN